jgi:hypothetical protein
MEADLSADATTDIFDGFGLARFALTACPDARSILRLSGTTLDFDNPKFDTGRACSTFGTGKAPAGLSIFDASSLNGTPR